MLTPKQTKAIQALLTHSTKAEAARAAGIGTRTLTDYLANDEFQREYSRAARALVMDATREAQQALSPALKALREIVENPEEASSNRNAAARSLLEYGLRLTEFSDILPLVDAAESEN